MVRDVFVLFLTELQGWLSDVAIFYIDVPYLNGRIQGHRSRRRPLKRTRMAAGPELKLKHESGFVWGNPDGLTAC